MENIIKQIELTYGFPIKSYSAAPRGFWAETYILNTDNDTYFIKIYKDFPWELALRTSLDIQYQMAEQVEFIPKPIKTLNNMLLHRLKDNRLIAIYSYINAVNYNTNDVFKIFDLMIDIYRLNIKCDNVYSFKFYAEKIMGEIMKDRYVIQSEILHRFIKHNREVYIKYWNLYVDLVTKVRNKNSKFYLTHGDLAKNLMIDDNKQMLIVDWDRIHLAPIELDLCEFINKHTDIKKLEDLAKRHGLIWKFDKEYHNYFLLNRLYYNLRNLLIQNDNDKITADSLIEHQLYLDNIDEKWMI